MTPSKQTWLITGCSSGIGEAIAHAALRRGDNVIATARMGLQRLQVLKKAGAMILDLDVRAPQAELDSIIQEALKMYGGIDVLVNNAAYLGVGVLEEVSHEELVSTYNTNFFGAVNLTRSLLPHLRSKRSGNLVYIGSLAAYLGEFACFPYVSTKGALESFIECVSKDVSLFNVKCMLVTLGEFRTNAFSETNISWASTKIEDYAAINDALRDGLKKADQAQPGDPNKAAELVVDGVKGQGGAEGRAMPTRLVIGADAFQTIRNKCRMMLKVCDEWEEFGSNTNFDGVIGGNYDTIVL